MRLVVVYNPKSGSTPDISTLTKLCADQKLDVEEFIRIDDRLSVHLAKIIRAHPAITVAVIGGDGSMGMVADILRDTDSTLAPLPGGTLNHFSKDLGVPQDLSGALANLHAARAHKIDVASVNGRVFVNNSSLGLYPSSLQTRHRFDAKLGKWPAAVIGILRALIRYQLLEVTLDSQTHLTPFVFIGNNRYHVGPTAAGRDHLNKGILSVYVITTSSRWQLCTMLGYALTGRLQQHESLEVYETESLIIRSTHRHLSVSTDGELLRVSPPLTYRIHPKSLRIIGSS